MKLLKPDWVSHNGKPIFSIDIHPDDSRLATGGQGDDSGKVVIWNMAPIRDEKEEADVNVPRVLCQMDSHLGCVNCVRWSENGKFLASGGDDKLIMIWQISRGFGSGKSFGSNVTIVEHWRTVATLRGHSGDVLDVAWSPQDLLLASCSVDNTIVVWNALKFPEQVAVLTGHSGLVKGVTWDPVGKYLASQSDDKTLRVWRTTDWKEETSVTSCFKECGGTTHVLRLNWSPDGNHIVSAHAMNNAGPTAQIVERNGWGASLDFVGHRKAITVVKFNPKILAKPLKKTADPPQQYSCCAIGSKDRSLSVWLTALKRPLVVLHDMFEKSILDVSWSRVGLELMCCSIDGSVAYVVFDEGEIGSPISKDAQQALLDKTYGKSTLTSSTLHAPSQIIESAAVLSLQQQQQQQSRERQPCPSLTSTPSKSSSSLLPNGDMPFKPRDKQIETRTSDGRRRITPIFLAPQPDMGEVGVPTPYTTKSIAFKTTKETSKIVVEKQDRVTLPGMTVSSNSSHSQSQSLQSPPQPTPAPGAESAKPAAGEEPRPVAMTTAAITPLHTPMDLDTPLTDAADKAPSSRAAQPESKDKAAAAAAPTPVSTKERAEERTPGKERREGGEKGERPKLPTSLKKLVKAGRGRPRKVDRDAREALMTAALSHAIPATSEVRETARPVSTSQLQLPVPKAEKTTSKLVEGQTGADNTVTIEVENDLQAGSGQLHRCRCVRAGTVLWEQLVSSRILAVAGSRQVTCVACEDKTLSLFGPGGKRLLPPLMLGSLVSVLKCSGHHVMAVTAHGSLHIWNVTSGVASVQGQSLTAIMSGGEKLVQCTLTNQGVPLLTVSSGKSYSFAPELGAWMVINDREDRLQTCSNHHGCVPSRIRTSGLLASVQGSGRAGQQAGQVFVSGGQLQQTSTLSHLETQVSTCLALQSPAEHRLWLETYVRYLAQEGLEDKLRAVCDDLLGPVFTRSTSQSSWQPSVLGLNKREFLRSLLPVIGANLRWQRLYTEYHDQLESLAPAR